MCLPSRASASGVAVAPSRCSGSARSPPLLDADSTADASSSAAGVALLLGKRVREVSAGAHSGLSSVLVLE